MAPRRKVSPLMVCLRLASLNLLPPYTRLPAISPWQTKAAPNMFREYLFNGYRRLAGEFKFWAIPFGIGTQRPCLMLGIVRLIDTILLQVILSTRGPRVMTTIRIAKQVTLHREQRTTRAFRTHRNSININGLIYFACVINTQV